MQATLKRPQVDKVLPCFIDIGKRPLEVTIACHVILPIKARTATVPQVGHFGKLDTTSQWVILPYVGTHIQRALIL